MGSTIVRILFCKLREHRTYLLLQRAMNIYFDEWTDVNECVLNWECGVKLLVLLNSWPVVSDRLPLKITNANGYEYEHRV